jgi:putative ABC transport system permease protein
VTTHELRSPRSPGLRAAFRLARRNAFAAPGRSALIVALVGIPVMGLSGVATVDSSMSPTVGETISTSLGRSQAMLQMMTPPDPTLTQSPNDPTNTTYAVNSQGEPAHHLEGGALVEPSTFMPGVRMIAIRPTSVTARTAHGQGSLGAIEGDAWDASLSGHYDRLSGRTPTTPTEVMATPSALVRLGAQVGDTIDVLAPREGHFTIVGTLADRTQPSSVQTLFAESAALDGVQPNEDLASTHFYLPYKVMPWPKLRAANAHGAGVLSRAVLLAPPTNAALGLEGTGVPFAQLSLVFPLAGFALFEVALLAGAAFMVGARRQQRALAVLSSVGGQRHVLFAVIAFGGVLLGLVGGILGSAVGVAAALGYIRMSADGSATQYPGFHIPFWALTGIILFAALAGLIAAAVPALAASRVDVVGALRGASRPRPIRRRRPLIGAILSAFGAVVTLVGGFVALLPQPGGRYNPATSSIGLALVVAGPIAMQLGAILIAPLLLRAVSRLLARAGLGARLGSRDAYRNASRSVPALAAIMTTIFVGAFIMTFNASSEAQERAGATYFIAPGTAASGINHWSPHGSAATAGDANRVVDLLNSTFHVANARVLSASLAPAERSSQTSKTLFASATFPPSSACPDGRYSTSQAPPGYTTPPCEAPPYALDQRIWVGSVAQLSLALGEPATAQSRATLAAGGAVSLYAQYVHEGHVTIGWRTAHALFVDSRAHMESPPSRSVTLPTTIQRPAHDYQYAMFVSPETARSIGLQFGRDQVLVKLAAAPTDAQADSVRAAEAAIAGGGSIDNSPITFAYEEGPPNGAGPFAWAVLLLCAIMVLGASSVAIGLARADGRRDDYVLGATGASPRLRRSFGFWQAICLAGTGALIGVGLGVLPVIALSQPGQGGLAFSAPVAQLLVLAFGVPLVIAASSWLVTRTGRTASSSELARS